MKTKDLDRYVGMNVQIVLEGSIRHITPDGRLVFRTKGAIDVTTIYSNDVVLIGVGTSVVDEIAAHVPMVPIAEEDTLDCVKIIATADVLIPNRQTEGSVGYDLCADSFKTRFCQDIVQHDENITVFPDDIVTIGTGVSMAIPKGLEGSVRARSSLCKKGLIMLNGIGTIDNDYRGEIMVVFKNISSEPVTIKHNERIAQIVFNRVEYPTLMCVDKLGNTDRGSGGFGSTGS